MDVEVAYQGPAASTGLGGITAAARLRDKHEMIRGRTLSCYALVYVTEGGGTYWDAAERRSRVEPGTLFCLMPEVEHTYGPERGTAWTELYLLFQGPVFDLWREHELGRIFQPAVLLQPVSFWEERLLRVWADGASPLEVVSRLQSFLADVAAAQHPSDASAARWLNEARRLLAANPLDRLAVRSAAREMGLSYERFRKVFKQRQGISAGAYRRSLVMDEAARRILSRPGSLKAIALELGFCDEFHFSRQFKQHFGASPREFRQRLRGRGAPGTKQGAEHRDFS